MKNLFTALSQKFKKSTEPVEVPKSNAPIYKSQKTSMPDYTNGSFLKYFYDDENIAGVQHRDLDFSKINISHIRFEFEPNNQYDSNAIRIYQGDIFLGYVHKGRTNEMIHSYLKNPDWDIYAKINTIDEANQALKYQIAFYKQISETDHELVFEKDTVLTKTSKRADEFSTSRQEALSYLSEGDTVTIEESYDSDNLLVLNDVGDELGELGKKISETIISYIDSGDYICFGTVQEITEDDNGKYGASISVKIYGK